MTLSCQLSCLHQLLQHMIALLLHDHVQHVHGHDRLHAEAQNNMQVMLECMQRSNTISNRCLNACKKGMHHDATHKMVRTQFWLTCTRGRQSAVQEPASFMKRQVFHCMCHSKECCPARYANPIGCSSQLILGILLKPCCCLTSMLMHCDCEATVHVPAARGPPQA